MECLVLFVATAIFDSIERVVDSMTYRENQITLVRRDFKWKLDIQPIYCQVRSTTVDTWYWQTPKGRTKTASSSVHIWWKIKKEYWKYNRFVLYWTLFNRKFENTTYFNWNIMSSSFTTVWEVTVCRIQLNTTIKFYLTGFFFRRN